MKIFITIWFFVLAILFIISLNLNGESTDFYGICETKEIIINSDYPVEVKKIHIIEGQTIAKNDTLIELHRPDLLLKISETSHLLDELKAQKNAKASLSRSQIRQLKAQQKTRINEIRAQIRQLEAQYELNKTLTAELKSFSHQSSKQDQSDNQNPLKIKIANLKKELAFVLNPSKIKINMLENELTTNGNQVNIHILRLENELRMLLEEKTKLVIFSQIDGIIGSVNFKEGEKVSPFTAIVTLHNRSPSYIKGYIHENVYNKVTFGQQVRINSLTDKGNNTSGQIVGVGSRIVDYPIRLRTRQEIPIWGREVIIKIAENNHFLLGEKVLIKSQPRNQFARF